VCYRSTDVSGELTASILLSKYKPMKQLRASFLDLSSDPEKRGSRLPRMSDDLYRTTRRQIPEDSILYIHLCDSSAT
jgi:hypothetical protein